MVVEFARMFDNGSWDVDYITLSRDYTEVDLYKNAVHIYLVEKGIDDSVKALDECFPGLINVCVHDIVSEEDNIKYN